MPECPCCFGERFLDLRDLDAFLEEYLTEEQLRMAVAAGMRRKVGIIECEECEATGVISEERARDLRAASIAFVDQVRAKMEDPNRVFTEREKGALTWHP